MTAATMQAMVYEGARRPLVRSIRARPEPRPGQVLIEVRACGVCRTDLHLIDDELPHPKLPVIPGHEIVGRVIAHGPGVTGPRSARASVCPGSATPAAIANTASQGARTCARPRFTGYQLDGGYAELAAADARFVFELPERYADVHAAPLMCAGLIGYRSYAMAGDAGTHRPLRLRRGGASHRADCARVSGARCSPSRVPATLPRHALRARSASTGPAAATSVRPSSLDAALIFAPAGALVPVALTSVKRGGSVVCAAAST